MKIFNFYNLKKSLYIAWAWKCPDCAGEEFAVQNYLIVLSLKSDNNSPTKERIGVMM